MNNKELTDADLTSMKLENLKYVDDEELELYLKELPKVEKTMVYTTDVYVSDLEDIGDERSDLLNSEQGDDILFLCCLIATDKDDALKEFRNEMYKDIIRAKKYFKRWT